MKEFALSSLVGKIAKCAEYCMKLKSAINFKIEKKMDSPLPGTSKFLLSLFQLAIGFEWNKQIELGSRPEFFILRDPARQS